MPASPQQVGTDIEAMLDQCCKALVPVTTVFPDLGAVASCAFSETTPDDLTLIVENIVGLSGHRDLRMASCLSSFPYQNSNWAFFSVVREQLGPASQPEQLKLAIPERLLRTDRRASFRVPIFESHGLRAQLSDGSVKTWEAVVKDLSLTGTGIAFPAQRDPDLPQGAEARIRLWTKAKSVTVRAIVRHRRGNEYGLLFPDCAPKGQVAPPSDYRSLFTEIQNHWLKHRAHAKG